MDSDFDETDPDEPLGVGLAAEPEATKPWTAEEASGAVPDRIVKGGGVDAMRSPMAAGLQPPAPMAMARAEPIFRRLLAQQEEHAAQADAPLEGAAVEAEPSQADAPDPYPRDMAPPAVGGWLSAAAQAAGRSYPIAEAAVAHLQPPLGEFEERLTEDVVAPPSDAADVVETDADADMAADKALARPPPGTAQVRAGVRRQDAAPDMEGDAQAAARAMAAEASFVENSQGGMTDNRLCVAIDDAILGPLTCELGFNDGKVVAFFEVADVHARRLFEAESGRLRAALEDRGMRVMDIQVAIASSGNG